MNWATMTFQCTPDACGLIIAGATCVGWLLGAVIATLIVRRYC